MPDISVTIGSVTVTKVVTAGQATRIADALKVKYGPFTTTDVLTRECNAVIREFINEVRAIEVRVAQEAVALPAPIEPQ